MSFGERVLLGAAVGLSVTTSAVSPGGPGHRPQRQQEPVCVHWRGKFCLQANEGQTWPVHHPSQLFSLPTFPMLAFVNIPEPGTHLLPIRHTLLVVMFYLRYEAFQRLLNFYGGHRRFFFLFEQGRSLYKKNTQKNSNLQRL